ncbi:MAG TPA: IPT/TIG domain-containing protein [Anaeromyxobacteraceae bacterium]|nr:IPT/TIG domain-containing protein [Anaeromyxobacteraceae bacterium]
MRKLLRDLEYTKGLPEPPQQVVQPQPEPWRRDPTREGPPPEITGVSPRRGRVAGGERVEIRGRNLRVVSVMFGASPARLLAATDSLVTVESPAGSPGPATIALTNEDGTWGVAAEPYVYGE